MTTIVGLLDHWLRRIMRELYLVLIPGIAGLILLDINFGIFQGEFGIEDLTNINTVVLYYADKLDVTGHQQFPYIIVMLMMVYFLGYFLSSSSKYFVGPKRFRVLMSVKEAQDELHMPLPPSAAQFLSVKAGDLPDNAGAEACQALIDASGIPSTSGAFENRSGLYRALGYLFFLLALFDLALFMIEFDFTSMIMKFSICILNIVFSFLFFKGQEENSLRWKEQMSAEALVAIKQLSK